MNKNKKENKLIKWLRRIAFLLLILLLLFQLHHFSLAIEALARFNIEQGNLIHTLQQQVHSLQVSNVDLHNQVEMMTVKINGLEIHNIPHTATQIKAPDLHTEIHTESPLHIDKVVTPVTVITTTAIAVLAALKTIGSFIPVLP
jgi:hypothetical protein